MAIASRSAAALVVLVAGASAVLAQDAEVDHLQAAGARFPYVDTGSGEPILFVHGAFSDHRVWEPVREDVARNHRFLAYTQRHFGPWEWPAEPGFERDVHEADLTALLETWGEPMHVVGWSYSGPVVLQAALDRPDLVQSLVIYEPSHPELVAAQPDGEALLQQFMEGFGEGAQALEQGDLDEALKKSLEYVLSLDEGFDALPELNRRMALENAHTLPMMFGAPEPTPMTCEDLGRIDVPTLILLGSDTLPFFAASSRAVADCLPNAEIRVIEGATHAGPVTHADEMLEQLLGFVDERVPS